MIIGLTCKPRQRGRLREAGFLVLAVQSFSKCSGIRFSRADDTPITISTQAIAHVAIDADSRLVSSTSEYPRNAPR